MQKIESSPPMPIEQHSCVARAEGDWIVFRCPKCPDYERRINWRTGQMESRNVKSHVIHTGNSVPEELEMPSGYRH